uniref:ZP domain-containing protein n=1 Tax=Parastrongyloides trichosuri TaxID=131310 RepID=A0A0N4ZBN5_PARTI
MYISLILTLEIIKLALIRISIQQNVLYKNGEYLRKHSNRTYVNETAINSLMEPPFIVCSPDAIYISMRTISKFRGHAYVLGVPNQFCYYILISFNQIEILIPYMNCKLKRERWKDEDRNDSGFKINTNIMISFNISQSETDVDFNGPYDNKVSANCKYKRSLKIMKEKDSLLILD